jgi:hypothetical protein
MVVEAKRRWALRDMPGEVGWLTVNHVGDENAYVSVYRAGSDRVSLVGQAVHFHGGTGRVIHEEPPPPIVSGILEFLTGLHLQHFEHWLLRWLYVAGGLSGTVCIATGLVFFVQKRKQREPTLARWIDALAVATITGTLLATASILVASLALPRELADRAAWQERVFWFTWLAALAHAATRSGRVLRGQITPAYREQCLALSAVALLAVLVNAATTGDHLGRTVTEGNWPVAGVDLALLVVATLSALTAKTLGRLERRAVPESASDSAEPEGEVANHA